MKRAKRWAKRLGVLLGILGLGLLGANYAMNRADAEHARFFQTGKSINAFLKEYGQSLRAAITTHNADPVARHYAADYHSPGRGRWVLGPSAALSGAAVSDLRAEGGVPYTRDDLTAELAAYVAGVASVEDVIVKIDLIESLDPGRQAVLTVKFILDGRDRQGAYFQDRHFYRWHLANASSDTNNPDWRITRDELVEGVRAAGPRDGFRAIDLPSAGIEYKHARDPHLDPEDPNAQLKFGVIQHAGCGVAATDVDGDGRPDLFFADGVQCRLFRNVTTQPGEPRFEDVTDRVGLGGLDRVNAGVVADLDNDGVKDLVVIRYCAPSKLYRGTRDGAFVTFADRTAEMGFALDAPSLSACLLDYDRDGFPDLYVGVYGNAFTDIPRLPFFAENGGQNRLFRNVGGKRFDDVTDAAGCGDTGWSMAVAAADLDSDGWPDLLVTNDFGKKSLYRNNGDGTFAETTKRAGVLDFSGGMGVAVADFDDDGRLDLYFANINSNQRWFGEDMTNNQYIRNVVRTRWLLKDFGEYQRLYDLVGDDWRQLGQQIGKGNSLFRNNGDGTFKELTDSHTHRAGWSWGVVFFDMDNDSALDLFAANGWITNTSKDDL